MEVVPVRFCDCCPDHPDQDEFRPMVEFPVMRAPDKHIHVYLCEKCLKAMLASLLTAAAPSAAPGVEER